MRTLDEQMVELKRAKVKEQIENSRYVKMVLSQDEEYKLKVKSD